MTSKREAELVQAYSFTRLTRDGEERIGRVRGLALALAGELDRLVPAGEAQFYAHQHLRETVFWANAGIASGSVPDQDPENTPTKP